MLNGAERIRCSRCMRTLPVADMQIHCAGCNKYYHCGIAGTCACPRCTGTTPSGAPHSLAWCTGCAGGREGSRASRCRCPASRAEQPSSSAACVIL